MILYLRPHFHAAAGVAKNGPKLRRPHPLLGTEKRAPLIGDVRPVISGRPGRLFHFWAFRRFWRLPEKGTYFPVSGRCRNLPNAGAAFSLFPMFSFLAPSRKREIPPTCLECSKNKWGGTNWRSGRPLNPDAFQTKWDIFLCLPEMRAPVIFGGCPGRSLDYATFQTKGNTPFCQECDIL